MGPAAQEAETSVQHSPWQSCGDLITSVLGVLPQGGRELCATQGPSSTHFCHFVTNLGARKLAWIRSTKDFAFVLAKGLCVGALNKVMNFPG